jgi:hypothetical protein
MMHTTVRVAWRTVVRELATLAVSVHSVSACSSSGLGCANPNARTLAYMSRRLLLALPHRLLLALSRRLLLALPRLLLLTLPRRHFPRCRAATCSMIAVTVLRCDKYMP